MWIMIHDDFQEVVDCMNALRDLFTKKVKEISADQGVMSAAVSSWGLLLTVASTVSQQEAIEKY